MPKLKTPLEREVLEELLKWLNKQDGIWAWRRNVGLMKFDGRFLRYGQKGMSDIEGLITIEDCKASPGPGTTGLRSKGSTWKSRRRGSEISPATINRPGFWRYKRRGGSVSGPTVWRC